MMFLKSESRMWNAGPAGGRAGPRPGPGCGLLTCSVQAFQRKITAPVTSPRPAAGSTRSP